MGSLRVFQIQRLVLCLLLFHGSNALGVDRFFVQKAKTRQLKIMSFNVLNLYDTTHDRGFADFTFLPENHPKKMEGCSEIHSPYYRNLCEKLNWNKSRLRRKIAQIEKALRAHGSLPDILALQEVENRNVVKTLAKTLGYKNFLVTDQPSKRGIDVALLWNGKKLRYIDHKEIPAPLRDPLRVEFELTSAREPLFVYVNHWPAQSAPVSMRIRAGLNVKSDIDDVINALPEANIVALGDFNTTPSEENSVIRETLTGYRLRNRLYDIHELSKRDHPSYHKAKWPGGTYWRGGYNWNRFDRIFINRNLLRGSTQVPSESYRILASDLLTGKQKFENPETGQISRVLYPLSYNFLEEPGRPLGFSDHLPVTAILQTQPY